MLQLEQSARSAVLLAALSLGSAIEGVACGSDGVYASGASSANRSESLPAPGKSESALPSPVASAPSTLGFGPVTDLPFGGSPLALDQFGGDEGLDFAVLRPEVEVSSRVDIYVRDAAGAYPAQPSQTLEIVPEIERSFQVVPVTLTSADLDGDGLAEVIVGHKTLRPFGLSYSFSFFTHGAGGAFGPARHIEFRDETDIAGSEGRVAAIQILDINGDGRPDIVTADREAGGLAILLQRDAPAPYTGVVFGDSATHYTDAFGQDIFTATPDALPRNPEHQPPPGQPGSGHAAVWGAHPDATVVADVDGDGYKDVVALGCVYFDRSVQSCLEVTVDVFRYDRAALGLSGPTEILLDANDYAFIAGGPVSCLSGGVAAADELVVATPNGRVAFIANGVLQTAAESTLPGGPLSFLASDLNGDRALDLIATGAAGTHAYLGDGKGHFVDPSPERPLFDGAFVPRIARPYSKPSGLSDLIGLRDEHVAFAVNISAPSSPSPGCFQTLLPLPGRGHP